MPDDEIKLLPDAAEDEIPKVAAAVAVRDAFATVDANLSFAMFESGNIIRKAGINHGNIRQKLAAGDKEALRFAELSAANSAMLFRAVKARAKEIRADEKAAINKVDKKLLIPVMRVALHDADLKSLIMAIRAMQDIANLGRTLKKANKETEVGYDQALIFGCEQVTGPLLRDGDPKACEIAEMCILVAMSFASSTMKHLRDRYQFNEASDFLDKTEAGCDCPECQAKATESPKPEQEGGTQ